MSKNRKFEVKNHTRTKERNRKKWLQNHLKLFLDDFEVKIFFWIFGFFFSWDTDFEGSEIWQKLSKNGFLMQTTPFFLPTSPLKGGEMGEKASWSGWKNMKKTDFSHVIVSETHMKAFRYIYTLKIYQKPFCHPGVTSCHPGVTNWRPAGG